MGIIKAIVEKLKIKELFAILFIAGVCFSLIPSKIADKMEILELRNRYQSFVSIGLIIIGSYYVLHQFTTFINEILVAQSVVLKHS